MLKGQRSRSGLQKN